ncbi:MAG: selenocysteine synthase [Verrucomicrobia bacterium]|nr:selenocysteine synthase [Verrucomicrobiota bacterium]
MQNILSRWNRRHFMSWAGLASLWAGSSNSHNLCAASPDDKPRKGRGAGKGLYEQLGVRPLINAAGTFTTLSGCLMPREVVEAMDEASRHHISISELQQAVGKRIAELVGSESALVTAGAAAALTLGTAACVAGKDQGKILRLPDTTGMRNEVLIQRSHRFAYDHAVRAVGIKLIEVETRRQLESAINARTALLLFLNSADPKGQIRRKEFVELGKRAGVPTFIDAAADVPPPERLSEYVRLGFDLVAFSGGKGLRGPQCSGLLLGRRELIEAAFLNGSPHSDTIGRLAKVGKEEIVGLWTALELYLKRDHKAERREWETRVREIAGALENLRGVKTETFVPEIANESPHLRVRWDEGIIPKKNADVVRLLRDGEPRIEVRPSGGGQPVVEVAVWMLQPDEHRIVAKRLRQVLERA